MLHLLLLKLVVLAPFFVLGPLVGIRALGGAAGWATIATAMRPAPWVGNPGRVALATLLAAVLVMFALGEAGVQLSPELTEPHKGKFGIAWPRSLTEPSIDRQSDQRKQPRRVESQA